MNVSISYSHYNIVFRCKKTNNKLDLHKSALQVEIKLHAAQ